MLNTPYTEVKFELRPSKVIPGQVGLFALKDFAANEIIVDPSFWDESRLISWQEFNTLDDLTKTALTNFCYKDDEYVYAPADINKIKIAYFFNHSCDPNSFSDTDGNYIASRKINAGEEFTIDVEKLMKKTVKEFKCICGSPNCRGIVRI